MQKILSIEELKSLEPQRLWFKYNDLVIHEGELIGLSWGSDVKIAELLLRLGLAGSNVGKDVLYISCNRNLNDLNRFLETAEEGDYGNIFFTKARESIEFFKLLEDEGKDFDLILVDDINCLLGTPDYKVVLEYLMNLRRYIFKRDGEASIIYTCRCEQSGEDTTEKDIRGGGQVVSLSDQFYHQYIENDGRGKRLIMKDLKKNILKVKVNKRARPSYLRDD